MRKLAMNIVMSLLLVGVLAGVSMAAPGGLLSAEGPEPEDDVVEDEPGDGEPGDGEPGDGEPGDGEPGDDEPGDGEPGDGDPGDGEPGDEDPGDGEPGDEEPGDGESEAFGEVRSAEVSAFGACKEALQADGALGHESHEECEELKPGPAVTSPSHPVFGEDGKHPGKHEAKAEARAEKAEAKAEARAEKDEAKAERQKGKAGPTPESKATGQDGAASRPGNNKNRSGR
jgi:hypothetical protein